MSTATPSSSVLSRSCSSSTVIASAQVYTVQFKWGRTSLCEASPSLGELCSGDHVLVAAEGGVDLGVVAGPSSSSGPALQLFRKATEKEVCYWKTVLVDEEARARRAAAAVFPENEANLRVLKAEVRFDRRKLTLYYTKSSQSADVVYRPYMKKLFSTFPGVRVAFLEDPGIEQHQQQQQQQHQQQQKPPRRPFVHHARGLSIDSVLSAACLSSTADSYDDGYSTSFNLEDDCFEFY